MTLDEGIRRSRNWGPPELPSLVRLKASIKRIDDRWPDIEVPMSDADDEAWLLLLLKRIAEDWWEGEKVSDVIRVAGIAIQAKNRTRPDLAPLVRFLIQETRVSKSRAFLTGMFREYLQHYEPGAPHTIALADALRRDPTRLDGMPAAILRNFSDVFDAREAHFLLAARMATMQDPWIGLKAMGFRNPHDAGLLLQAHLVYVGGLAPSLHLPDQVDRLLGWLKPAGRREARQTGAKEAVEALLRPWETQSCPQELQKHLQDTLLAYYGDPRTKKGGIWAGMAQTCLGVMLRWLTEADMLAFMDVITATQDSHMWPPRRDYWMHLYRQGQINAAWVAFCPSAAEYGRRNLAFRTEVSQAARFGRQTARGTRLHTSLLLMKIGRKIVVDGCHNYKTHIFDQSDPRAPKLFERNYDCEQIRHLSDRSRQHHPIESWIDWVERNT